MVRPKGIAAAFAAVGIFAASTVLAEDATASRRWISGGVGSESRAELDAASHDYSLKIVFAVKEHEAYLSDVPFVIRDGGGTTVAEGVSEGPWLYVDLPAGSYEVEATAEGETMKQDVSVPASGQAQVSFHFTRGESASGTSASR